jgi:hypothetical protein
MKRIALVLGLGVFASVMPLAAQEAITAYSAVIDADVPVRVLKVAVTPTMSHQDFCTLMTSTYCGPTSYDTAEPPALLLQ